MKVAVLVVLSLACLGVQSKSKRDTLFGYPLGQHYYPRPHAGSYATNRDGYADVYTPTAGYGSGVPFFNNRGDPYRAPSGPSHYGHRDYAPGYPAAWASSPVTDYDPYGTLDNTPGANNFASKQGSPSGLISFQKYNTVEQIDAYLDYLESAYPDIVDVSIIGNSAEGRPIRAVRIHPRQLKRNSKPKILVDAGIHAREWIAPAVALYMINQLVENNDNYRNMTENLEWHIIPLLNPDGYAYSMTEDRMWRKNRSNTSNPLCPGVDLNRNFELFFGGAGTSTDPCDETYTGTGPFSEPESRALRDYALSLRGVRLYLTLHSYGQFFLYPWGFGDSLPRDWKDLDHLGRIAQRTLQSVRGTKYRVGSSTQVLGAAAGGSDDWMKGRANVKYSYTVELPGGGDKGFNLPAERILSVSQETWEALRTMGNFISAERVRQRAKKSA